MDHRAWFGSWAGVAAGFLVGASGILGDVPLFWLGVVSLGVAISGFAVLRWKQVGIRRSPDDWSIQPSAGGRYRMSLNYAPGETDGGLVLAVRHPFAARVAGVSMSPRQRPGETKGLRVAAARDSGIRYWLFWTVANLSDWRIESEDEVVITLSALRDFSPRRVRLYRRT